MSVLEPIVESLGAVEADGVIRSETFLATCRLILPVFGEHPPLGLRQRPASQKE